jgi:putative membrane-bound dehydrogenase-like protein
MNRIVATLFTLLVLSTGRLTLAEVAFSKAEGQLTITVDGQLFAVYVWNDPATPRPYFKQVFAPGGEIQITRNHPPISGDLGDHATYHPGIWWGFGDVGGNDYWRLKAKIIGGDFIEEPKGGKDQGSFTVRDKMLVQGGEETFCEQICRYTILKRPGGVLLVCDSTMRREQGDFWLGDQEEMGLAVRVATPIATASAKGGRILNSDLSSDLEQIRTKQSDWCDYSGPINGNFGGMLVMNNPDNFRKPWWHAVDTGLIVANPLGESELNGRGKKKQNVRVKSGSTFRLSYGVLVHLHAKATDFDPADAYKDYLDVLLKLNRKELSQSDLPQVPDGFRVSVFAQEPMVFKPTSICFDARGRLFVGQGPQYPENYENSPTDSVYVLIDSNHDGVADQAKEFAKGFNSVQGLAWRGNDLYVANSPELTVVRDLDGDDEADEYVVVYTDLGNREHALHGLNWAPDGKLYMSKGNSKGHNQPEKTGYVAPKPFRVLWDVEHPAGAPDAYPPKLYTKDTYRKTYHHWDDDWGREGGVLRCDPMGENLEIVSRGLRNPWDIAMDASFHWLGTDNDQSQGDRFVMPFYGAHFGWGHPYSSHWSGEENLPTVPVSGPMFPGSGAGIIYYDHENFPPEYRQVFILNDWLDGTFIYRPRAGRSNPSFAEGKVPCYTGPPIWNSDQREQSIFAVGAAIMTINAVPKEAGSFV